MKIVLTDPREISALMQYGEAGHYESMIKSGTNIHLYVSRNGTSLEGGGKLYLFLNVMAS